MDFNNMGFDNMDFADIDIDNMDFGDEDNDNDEDRIIFDDDDDIIYTIEDKPKSSSSDKDKSKEGEGKSKESKGNESKGKKKENIVYNFEIKDNLFTKDELSLNPNSQVFIKYSRVKSDALIKYFIIKYKPNMYKCSKKGCPTAKNNMWKRKYIYLILNRINNDVRDCRINNLELICPNCYCLEYGDQPFKKLIKTIGKTCVSCNYPLKSEYANIQKYCYICNLNIKKMSMNYNITEELEKKISSFDDDTNNNDYLSKFQEEYETFMNYKMKNPDLDLLSDSNKLLMPNNESGDIFKKYGFNKDVYLKANETVKAMSGKEERSGRTSNNSSSSNYKSRPRNKTIKNSNSNLPINEKLNAIKFNMEISNSINEELNNIV